MATKDQDIGFIGLGAMGRGMALNCAKKGFKLVVHDVRPEPVKELVSAGARAAASPGESGPPVFQSLSPCCRRAERWTTW